MTRSDERLVSQHTAAPAFGGASTASHSGAVSAPAASSRRPMHPDGANRCVDDTATANGRHRGSDQARETLVAAIIGSIGEQRLDAAHAAHRLHLTGRQVTDLLNRDTDGFTLDELTNLLPLLGLSIQVVPTPTR
jgi:predicted XRE-type DNA-binding protein